MAEVVKIGSWVICGRRKGRERMKEVTVWVFQRFYPTPSVEIAKKLRIPKNMEIREFLMLFGGGV